MGFFDNLTGGSSRRDIKKSKAKAEGYLQAGYDEAQPRYEEAYQLFQPYAQSGQQANERYNQLLGLGTPEERDAAQAVYTSDPAFQGMLGLESNRLLKQLNARGQTYGGTAALAGARVGLEGYNGYLNRLQGQGQQGFGAATNQAGIRTGQGDMRYGLGTTLAANEINAGNAIAQTRNTGINNLLSVGKIGADIGTAAIKASDIRLKHDIRRVGETASGIPVYDFKYLWSEDVHRGVMAQEAVLKFPDAISYSDDGFAMVDYRKIY